MKFLALIAFIFLSHITFSQKEIELKVSIQDSYGKPLEGITVEFRDMKNSLLQTTTSDSEGKSTFLTNPNNGVLIMAYDKTLKYSPDNRSYEKKAGIIEFNFRLKDISSDINKYTKAQAKLTSDSTVLDILSGCESSSSEPEYEGGNQAMAMFLQKTLRYPIFALDFGIGGRVYARFIIDENGEMHNIEIKRGLEGCKECDIEVLRVLSLMPKWIPATCNGKKVGMYYNLPIKFTPG